MTKSATEIAAALKEAGPIPALETDKLANAKEQGQAQFDSIREMVEALQVAGEGSANEGKAWKAYEDAERAIHEDALSVEVRSGWYSPGSRDADTAPAEYRILLCTGGPAVQIVGELSEHGEPETARMQVQDWFTPWTDFRPTVPDGEIEWEETLLTYARCFYFGE